MKVPKAKQLPSGAWNCRIRVEGRDLSITKPTEKEAVAEALAIKAGIKEAGKNPKKQTVSQAIDNYIESRQNVLSPSTVRGYRAIQGTRFSTMMHKSIGAITQPQWQRAVDQESRLCSAKTLTNAWRFLSSVIYEATGQRPAVRLPQLIQAERQWLTPAQIPVFVEAIKGRSIEIPALLALSSLRRSELLNLRWQDVDLEKGVLRVNGAAVYDEHGKLVRKRETKNKTSRRTVPIIPPLAAALQAVENRGEYVVTMAAPGIYSHINRVCASHGLPKVGVHGLRHSFASLAYHLGLPEKVAMEIGGWANDQTMHKIYTHLAEEDLKTHAKSFTDFFG